MLQATLTQEQEINPIVRLTQRLVANSFLAAEYSFRITHKKNGTSTLYMRRRKTKAK